MHTSSSPEEDEEDLASPWTSLRRRLYGAKSAQTNPPAPDPMGVIKMISEFTLAKENVQERMVKLSSPHSECRRPAHTNKQVPLPMYDGK